MTVLLLFQKLSSPPMATDCEHRPEEGSAVVDGWPQEHYHPLTTSLFERGSRLLEFTAVQVRFCNCPAYVFRHRTQRLGVTT